MKSKILYQTNNTTPNNNSSNSSNRNRNSVRCTNGKYSSTNVVTKLVMNKDIEKDICNNNDEEVSPDNDYLESSNQSAVSDSLNNNSIIDSINIKEPYKAVEDFDNDLNIDSVDLHQCSLHENYSLSNDEDGNNTDVENNADMEDESRKSSESMPENKTNLIVNYLPQNMSQEEMRTLFSSQGEVESCKLIRDKTTGQSLSYGFVNYQDAKDANAAIVKFNGLRLQNKVIKVSLARPSSETIKGANLYICGLPKSMSLPELDQLFSQYGKIITCRILVDNVTGNSKGVAFIRFDQRQEAENAIKNLNGHTPPNGTEPITVKLANTPFNINNSTNSQLMMSHNQHSEYISTSPNNNNSIPTTNGVRGMGPNVRSGVNNASEIIPRLDVIMQNHGHQSSNVIGPEYVQSTNHVMPNNHQIPFPPGSLICPPQMHSIATFPLSYSGIQHPCLQSITGPQGQSSVQSNSLVPINTNHHQSQYLSIDPISASTHIIDSNLCCLIVYNLSPDTKEGSLWQTFGPYGAVHSVNLARDPVTGKCRGFGFVTMPNYHEAIHAAQQLNGNPLDNRILQIFLNPGLKLPPVNPYVLPSVAP